MTININLESNKNKVNSISLENNILIKTKNGSNLLWKINKNQIVVYDKSKSPKIYVESNKDDDFDNNVQCDQQRYN